MMRYNHIRVISDKNWAEVANRDDIKVNGQNFVEISFPFSMSSEKCKTYAQLFLKDQEDNSNAGT